MTVNPPIQTVTAFEQANRPPALRPASTGPVPRQESKSIRMANWDSMQQTAGEAILSLNDPRRGLAAVFLGDDPLLAGALEDFHKATQLVLAWHGPPPAQTSQTMCGSLPSFCELLKQHDSPRSVCARFHQVSFWRSVRSETLSVRYCPFGLGHVVVPVQAGGKTVGLLECGRVLAHAPHRGDLWRLPPSESGLSGLAGPERVESAFLALPVYKRERLEASGRLLSTLLQPLSDRLQDRLGPVETVPTDRFDRVLSYIKSRMHEPLRLSEVAHYAALGSEHLCRLFKKRTGTTFTRHLAQIRLERACQLLRETELKINQVAEAAGFPSVWQFNYVFKRSLQITPSEYRGRASHHRPDSPGLNQGARRATSHAPSSDRVY